jgi:Necrosis inducing protein (NPP1)
MAPKRLATALSAAVLASGAAAVTSLSDANMTEYLNTGALDLAVAYSPVWFFGQAMDNPPCIPDWAFSGTPDSSDIYDSAHQTKPAPQCSYPDVGCNCRNPGVAIGNPAPPFPIYYTFGKCSDTEVRVAYNLFYQKDGATVGPIQTGHDFDWERVVIVHTKDTSSNTWAPSTALYSAHSGYNKYAWGDIQNTLTTDQVNAGDAKDPDGVKNQDHPKVYVAWSKHPNFDDRNTGWNDPLSQSDGNAFRSDDWWYYVDPKYYILSDSTTDAGKALGAANWGDASSNPPSVQASLCTQGN